MIRKVRCWTVLRGFRERGNSQGLNKRTQLDFFFFFGKIYNVEEGSSKAKKKKKERERLQNISIKTERNSKMVMGNWIQWKCNKRPETGGD